jgi:hypothetical protein
MKKKYNIIFTFNDEDGKGTIEAFGDEISNKNLPFLVTMLDSIRNKIMEQWYGNCVSGKIKL